MAYFFFSKTKIVISIFDFRFKKEYVGSYLATFMWHRMCESMKVDPFDQILQDIATHYDSERWRSLAAAEGLKMESTEKKQKRILLKGVDLVSKLPYVLQS